MGKVGRETGKEDRAAAGLGGVGRRHGGRQREGTCGATVKLGLAMP